MNYVVGFLFNHDLSQVALIRKIKPQWQAGKLNGVGGKIEPGETPLEAMVREFKEETGAYVPPDDWTSFGLASGDNSDGSPFSVEFFYAIGETGGLGSPTDEKVEAHRTADVVNRSFYAVGNIPWIISAAIDCITGPYPPKRVVVQY